MRELVILECTECKRRNYTTKKEKRNTPERLEKKNTANSSVSIRSTKRPAKQGWLLQSGE